MVILDWGTDGILRATAVDVNGAPLTGATGVVDIFTHDGTSVITGASMSEPGDVAGRYTYDIAAQTNLADRNKTFVARVVLTKAGKRATADIEWNARAKVF